MNWRHVVSRPARKVVHAATLNLVLTAAGLARAQSCGAECEGQLVMQQGDVYNYEIDGVFYRQPIVEAGGTRHVRESAINIEHQIFTLPFAASASVNQLWGWLYSPGSWHHAIDYAKGGSTFAVRAAAPGHVIFVGWDDWSGGTVVVSHDVPGEADRYRTIYMHLRNGPQADCGLAWERSVPALAGVEQDQYRDYLEATGCPQNPAAQAPDADYWGTAGEALDPGLLGTSVFRGYFLGYAGSTGPGGCGCRSPGGASGPNNHLHIFFAHRDPTDNLWYFFDPYGIYGPSTCYPANLTGAPGPCAQYPVAWLNGKPEHPRQCPFGQPFHSELNLCDSCPTYPGWQSDSDGDGFGDPCDNCPSDPNGDQSDLDGDLLGDACDRDIDGDNCENEIDQHPLLGMVRVGRLGGVCCDGAYYLWEGEDTDRDGLTNCEDLDDDNDGVCDDAEEEPRVCDLGPDACPVGNLPPGSNLLGDLCIDFGTQCPCATKDWLGCQLGDCFEFFVKITSAVNPDPTREVVFDRLEFAGKRLYLLPAAGQSLAAAAGRILGEERIGGAGLRGLGTGGPLRLELWRGTPGGRGTFVSLLAEFDPRKVIVGDLRRGRFLVLTPGESSSLIRIDASWLAGAAEYPFPDGDRDGIPDPFDNCPRVANPEQEDKDGDGVGEACGGAGARQRPGDCNQDGRLDLSDALCLFGFLFGGGSEDLPCGVGGAGDPANVVLLDWNRDRALDLSDGVSVLVFLFQGGRPHAAGRDCLEIRGCPEACVR
jgi:hypothetical protein